MSSLTHSVDDVQWLALLSDPKSQVRIDLAGFPFRHVNGPEWDSGLMQINQHLLYLVVEHSCLAWLPHPRPPLPAGTLCWVAPQAKFRFSTPEGKSGTVIARLRFDVCREEHFYQPRLPVYLVRDAWADLNIMQQMIHEWENPGPLAAWRIKSLLSLLSIDAFESHRHRVAGRKLLTEETRSRISRAVSEISGARMRPDTLAKLAGYSPDYFSRLFRNTYGMAPKTWLLKQRLMRGAMLLRQPGMRVSEVAETLGYESVFLFSRQFKKEYGMSPRQWNYTCTGKLTSK